MTPNEKAEAIRNLNNPIIDAVKRQRNQQAVAAVGTGVGLAVAVDALLAINAPAVAVAAACGAAGFLIQHLGCRAWKLHKAAKAMEDELI